MTLLEGDVNLRGKVSYVPQQAWMQNATLRENVLFGRKYKKDIYETVSGHFWFRCAHVIRVNETGLNGT